MGHKERIEARRKKAESLNWMKRRPEITDKNKNLGYEKAQRMHGKLAGIIDKKNISQKERRAAAKARKRAEREQV